MKQIDQAMRKNLDCKRRTKEEIIFRFVELYRRENRERNVENEFILPAVSILSSCKTSTGDSLLHQSSPNFLFQICLATKRSSDHHCLVHYSICDGVSLWFDVWNVSSIIEQLRKTTTLTILVLHV